MLLSVPLKVFVSIGEGRPMINAVSSGISRHLIVFSYYMIIPSFLILRFLNISSVRIWCGIQKSDTERKRGTRKKF